MSRRDPGVGRLLVASLHQGIADVLPTRLSFYESWLSHEGLRDGRIGVAPLYAVLSFLRMEGPAYGVIAARAGEYAAEWSVQSMSPFGRRVIKAAPRAIRTRLVLRAFRRFVRGTYHQSRAVTTLRGRSATLDLQGSLFCAVREPVPAPLCGFYAAAVVKMMSMFELPALSGIESCRATGKASCRLTVRIDAQVPLTVEAPA